MKIYNITDKDITFGRKGSDITIKAGGHDYINLATNESFNIDGLSGIKPAKAEVVDDKAAKEAKATEAKAAKAAEDKAAKEAKAAKAAEDKAAEDKAAKEAKGSK